MIIQYILGGFIFAVGFTALMFFLHCFAVYLITNDMSDEEKEKYYDDVKRGEDYPMDQNSNGFGGFGSF